MSPAPVVSTQRTPRQAGTQSRSVLLLIRAASGSRFDDYVPHAAFQKSIGQSHPSPSGPVRREASS